MGYLPYLFDPRSTILLAGLMGIMMSLVLFFMRRSYPSSIRGLSEWSRAPLVAFVSTLLFAARGFLPDFATIVVANMVLFQACILYYAGSQQFLRGRSDTRAWTALNLLLGVLMFWFSSIRPDFETRLAIVTFAVTRLLVSHAMLYVRHKVPVYGMRLMIGLLLAQALVAGVRFVSVILGMAGSGIMEATWIQSVYLTMYSFSVLFLSIAVVLMATDRVHTEFEYLATRDPLTGVLNRRALLDACLAEFAASHGATGRPAALLMVDLDHFKSINDRFGHQMGDAVLREAVSRMQQVIGTKGLLGRYGGEEFVVLLPHTAMADAMSIAARLKEGIDKPLPSDSPLSAVGTFAVSIGVATSDGVKNVDEVLAQADEALYRAKALGRGRVIATTAAA